MNITSREFGIRVLLVVVSSALAVLLVEAALQTLDVQRLRLWQAGSLFRLDDELIYSLKPGQARAWETGEFNEVARINGQGLRDSEIGSGGPFDRRVIATGDSFTYGHGVSAEESYPSQLERIFLEKDGRKTDVVNAGVPGYNADQSYKFYKTRLAGIPHDTLLFGLNENDVGENIDHPLYSIEGGELAPLDPRTSWIYRIGTLFSDVPGWVARSTLVNWVLLRWKDRYLVPQIPPPGSGKAVDWARDKILLEIEDLRKTCRRNRVEFVVVLLPGKGVSEKDYRWFLDAFPGGGPLVLNVAADPVWEERRAAIFFAKDPHLNAEGNRILAEKIHEGLSR
jgi:hypothetical protein